MSDTAGKRIAKNTGLMFGGKGLGAVLNVLVLLVAANALDPVVFGTLLILHAFVRTAAELGTFKSWQGLIRFGVPHHKAGNVPALHKLLRFCMGLDLVMAMLATGGAIAFLVLAHNLIRLPVDLLGIAVPYCLLILFRQRATSLGVLRLIDRFDLLALHALVIPCVRLIGSLIVWQAEGGLIGFVWVWFMASLFDYIVLWLMALRELHRNNLLKGLFVHPPTLKSPEAGLWGFSWIANIDSSLAIAKMELPLLVAGAVLGPAYAAVFKVAQQIASVLVKGTQQLDEVIYPELAKMIEAGEARLVWPLVLKTGALLVATAIVVGGIVAALGPDVLARLIDETYRESAPLALLLLLAGAISGAAAPLMPTLYAAGYPERALYARGAGVVLMLSLFVYLAHKLGELGPGYAFIIGDVLALGLAVWLTQKTLKDRIAKDDNQTTPS